MGESKNKGYRTVGINLVLLYSFGLQPLTAGKKKELLDKAPEDNGAAHELAIHSMRLGASFVSKLINDAHYRGKSLYDPEDLWQEVYIELYQAAKKYKKYVNQGVSYETWACSCIKNRMILLGKRESRYSRQVEARGIGTEEEFDNGDTLYDRLTAEDRQRIAESEAEDRELYLELHNAISEALDGDDYIIVTRRYGINCEREDYRQIAARVNRSTASVAKRLSASLEAIRMVVLNSVYEGQPKFPLLVDYWQDVDPDTLADAITPVFLDYYADDGEESIFNFGGKMYD